MSHYGVRCWFTDVPWMDHVEVRLAASAGPKVHLAVGVQDGEIIWKERDEGYMTEPFLKLGQAEMEAFAKAVGAHTQASDETLASLKDTRETRDRLLTVVEGLFKR